MLRKRVCITTNRLFHQDSHLVEFTTAVERQWAESGKNLLTLSETAFYPTSGGQPHDTGTISGLEVLDVYEEDESIIHVVKGNVDVEGNVPGKVNWARRHDHMQQHTGQHILSQALIQVRGIPTVGFTIGPDWSTIVLEKKPDTEGLNSALRLANSIVDEDRSVDVLLPTAAELGDLPIRGSLPEKDAIRVVRVAYFDWSPCGGTHCKSTGDVRLILVLGIRKEKDTYRLEFVCGRRAEAVALENAKAVSDVAAVLNVGASEIVERTQALVDKVQSHESTIDEMREARLANDCDRLLASLGESDRGIVAVILEGRTVQEVRQLAHLVVERPGTVGLLIGRDEQKVGLAFARSEDRSEDVNQIMRRVCQETGCRGGGNPAFATGGGGADVDVEKVLEVARRAMGK